MTSTPVLRSWAKANYGPSQQKTLHNLLKRELVLNFGFDNKLKIADVLVDSFLEIIETYGKDKQKLHPHQIVWPAVAKDDFPSYGKTMAETKYISVVLTLWTPEELEQLANGCNPKSLYSQRIARFHKQTFEQGAVLSNIDSALILNLSHGRISHLRTQWEKEHNEILPSRGSYHDLGTTFTHKRQIIELHLKGLMPSEIARKTNHDPNSVDRYIRDFERTVPFFKDNVAISKIAFYTRLTESLIKEYENIYNSTNDCKK
jgi:hypothetical protein